MWAGEMKFPVHGKMKKYAVEILFMDTMVAMVEFEAGMEDEEGIPELVLGGQRLVSTGGTASGAQVQTGTGAVEETMEELLAKLDVLTGLTEVKKNIRDHIII